ncbi:arrestin domain-containing protein 3-like [Salarias fasciatus]|uniref:Arrestin domain-containing protein 3-like n=1 Tax=Salarias fasciatus TaxID=181472 RepID=A0A672FF61_SALFA|nr:arrestin domain-containing protein 3-like [Salarias fasciatus]
MTIKKFLIEYDSINSWNTFTNGDVINGRIIVDASKEAKIQSLVFIATGAAQVVLTEYYGDNQRRVYVANEYYYEFKHHILGGERQAGTEIIGKGANVFPFTFRIPDGRIPSTFETPPGKIVHKLKAELHQSWNKTKTAKVHFHFVSKADMSIPNLLVPHSGCNSKNVRVFGSGTVSLDVRIDKMGYRQGEILQVTIEIRNTTSRSVKPKFVLYEKRSYFAQGHKMFPTREILKEKAEAVKASSGSKTVTKTITIPRELPTTILNCSIIKREYSLKVFLKIKRASNPEVTLPIVILPF